MDQFLRFKKAIIVQILITAAIVAAISIFLNHMEAARGFVLGSLFSMANFLLMVRHAPGRLTKQGKAATADGALNLAIRMALLAIPLYAAMTLPDFSMLWTAIGVFNLQFSILIYGLIVERFGLMNGSTTQGR